MKLPLILTVTGINIFLAWADVILLIKAWTAITNHGIMSIVFVFGTLLVNITMIAIAQITLIGFILRYKRQRF